MPTKITRSIHGSFIFTISMIMSQASVWLKNNITCSICTVNPDYNVIEQAQKDKYIFCMNSTPHFQV